MNTKYFLSFIILVFGITLSAVLINNTLAADVQFPVKELGNCQNETACRTYCDKPENIKACVNFAEENNLMSQEELQQAKKFINAGAKGPGGCAGKDNCEEYCNDISHIDECVSFAEKNNLIPAKDLAEAKKVQAAIKRGVKPPPCGNKNQCDVYCSEPDHMEECITFGVEAGFIQGKELEDSQKMLAALKKGIKPPPCKGKEACDEYCQSPDNMEVCMNFAIAAGFMSDKEKEDSQKVLQAIKKGVKPPSCKGKEECDSYCGQESHFEECMKFAEAAGFMSPEDAAMARKTGGKGPGGCKGKDECEALCNNPANQETCFNFAKENGMIPQEDLQKMEQGKQKFQESLNQAPPQVLDCLNSAVGSEIMNKFKSGTAMPPREIGDKMGECFQKVMAAPGGPGGPGGPGMPSGQGNFQAGPGGCKNPEECSTYCETHQEECKNFQAPSGGQGGGAPGGMLAPGTSGGQTSPGGCKTGEECQGAGQAPMGPTQMGPQEGFQPPPAQTPPASGQVPPTQQPPTGISPTPPTTPGPTAPATGGTAPAPMPGPTITPPPPPSSAISPEFLLGLIFGILK